VRFRPLFIYKVGVFSETLEGFLAPSTRSYLNQPDERPIPPGSQEPFSIFVRHLLEEENSMKTCLMLVFLGLVVSGPASAQSACAQLGVNCSHPTTPQRPSNGNGGGSNNGGGSSNSGSRNSNGDTGSQIRTYNHNLKHLRKSREVGAKADSALNKGKWSEAAKLFNEAIMDLPVDFDGGVGSENQQVRAGNLKALFWLNHAYCLDKMGQHEKAVSEWQWVVDNSASARPEDVARARTNITVTQQEIYEAQMERKRQEALKLHNSDFQPH
jgi:hypothetical protein